MGIVYKARDRETGEAVALKVLKQEISADPAVLQRFKNELRLARKITHRNVCRLYEFNRAGDVAYITMEFVEGESLRSFLRRGRLDLKTILGLAHQIAEGLQEAHRQAVVHRDLKPENVLVTPDGWAKIMDFGIARSLEVNTMTMTLIGTPAYMAPEQAKGLHVDHRADIYSFGLMLYEMVTGVPAFQADTPMAILLQQIQEVPRSPRMINPRVPDSLERLIVRCLQKDPNDRFATTQELLQDLDSQEASMRESSNSSPLHSNAQKEPAWSPIAAVRSAESAMASEEEFAMPRRTARRLFFVIQFGYLAMYCGAAYKADSLQRALEGLLANASGVGAPLVIVSAMCGVSIRLYLIASVGLNHPAVGQKFRRLFPVLFLLDNLWATSPLLLAQTIGYGLALMAVAALVYLPFGQRTLMQSISPTTHAGHPR